MALNAEKGLVDSLAPRLGRPVGVDERRFRVISCGSHADEIDSVRRLSILGPRPPEAVFHGSMPSYD
jgi:hypothetical protein